ncbi:hypothetical protein ONJ87_28130, partial [Salmonella enterica subsp. enterica serovar Anatum]|nr:hypothetical protein [Salmonella enterica subsp. enterica serovar Anatum]
RVMDALADYDAFQYDNNIKPDYCNANGLEMWDESLTDQDLEEKRMGMLAEALNLSLIKKQKNSS